MRFDAADFQRWSIEKIKLLLTRRRLLIVAFTVGAIALWLTADAIPAFFFNSKIFQTRLNEALDASGLAVSYQGVDVSLFKGVRMVGVRISFDKDFSRGRYLLEAPAVYLRVPFGLPDVTASDWLSRTRIIIEDGRLGYFQSEGEENKEVLAQLRRLLQRDFRYHVECTGCSLRINVKDNSYFQKITPVERVYFTFHHAGDEIKAIVRYESSAVGNADFFGRFKACRTAACEDMEGYWHFHPSRFNATILNSFQKEYAIGSGLFSGEMSIERTVTAIEKESHGKKTAVRVPFSNFQMAISARDFTILQKKLEWYRADQFTVNSQMRIQGESATGSARAEIEGYKIDAEFVDLRPDALPEKYLFRVEPKRFGNNTIHLPAHKKLQGLKYFLIDLSGRTGKRYAKSEIKLDIDQGLFSVQSDSHAPDIQIHEAHLALVDEKFTGKLRVGQGDSEAMIAAEGALELYPVAFKPRLNSLIRENGEVQERKIFALRGRMTAPLKIENLYFRDIEPYIAYWLSDYWQDVRDGMHYSWLPSHLKRREYFVRFFEYLDFNMPIEVKNFSAGNADASPLKGELFFAPQYSGGTFRLSSPDGRNWTSLSLSYAGEEASSPWYTHNLRLHLNGGYELLKPWFGDEYFEYFSDVELAYDNNYNGERAADHYLKSTAVADLRLKKVRLGAWARQEQLPLQWETVDIRASRENGNGRIQQVKAENENTVFTGYGDYKLFDKQLETQLKYSLVIK